MGRKPTSIRFNSMVFRELFKDLNYSKIADEWGENGKEIKCEK